MLHFAKLSKFLKQDQYRVNNMLQSVNMVNVCKFPYNSIKKFQKLSGKLEFGKSGLQKLQEITANYRNF